MSDHHDTADQKPLVLVDGSSYLYRAFHALPPLTNSRGMPTGAVKGVVGMLRRLQADYAGSTVVVIFDAKGKTFRDDIYPEYKAQRPPMPDDLRCQVEPLYEIIRATSMPMLVIEGVEADDVIGTLATRATEAGRNTVVSTGDKDLAQLVNEHVTLVNTMSNYVMDIPGVHEKFGIGPELIIDFLALMGDKVDNIPGVPGVGNKTALALLQGLGSLDTIYANLDKVAELGFRGSKTMGKKLEANKEQAYLSYELATIRTDLDLGCKLEDLVPGEEQKDKLLKYFEELEFRGWVKELKEGAPSVPAKKPLPSTVAVAAEASDEIEIPAAVETHYETVLEQAQFDIWLEQLKNAELFAFDTETTSLDYMEAEIVGVSFAVEAGKAAYVPLAHDYLDAPVQLDRTAVLEALKPLLEDDSCKKVGQNLKYDRSVLARYDIDLKGIAFDTMLESYVLDSTGTRHDMDSLAKKYLGVETIHFEDIAGKGAKQLTFNQIALEQAGPYAAEDADITLRLHQTLWPQLEKNPRLVDVFKDIELPLVPILSRIERNGALVDAGRLGVQSQEIAERLHELQELAWSEAGEEFNLSSPKQLQALLFDKLGLPVIKKTPKGQPSTAEEVLVELARSYKLPKLILEHRSLSKLKSTYTDKLPQMIKPATGRVHTSYHQAVTATGRLSSSDPNLQNIPVRSGEGRRIRQAFVARPGYKLVAADYSQIELRIMAHLSGDKGLLTAFAEGLDVHRATAAEVFDVALEDVTADQRRSAKAINFGLIYGMSAFGLAKQLEIPRGDAQKYVELYFARYPGVQKYMDETRALAHEQGYVETLAGRRLHLPEINARNKMRQQAAERTAINAPMQGTAADIIKAAMIAVDSWLQDDSYDARVIMQVHDELVLEVKEEQLDDVVAGLKECMSAAATLDVPLVVDAGIGDNWDEAH
ncbi:DNA polymerase I [Sansalvadorimonas verongulae]|uniref:DNA polymerase I n=1 Tax=Sansalvadorimonas verongulae TaxID=2172824 RepID=UPI0012BBCD8D|nr:DNA polymerase I [Sansalvadorimonas verongulae]MTI14946.1 DNA polymerase I [Sansalvadorimonas verongulae]